MKQLKMNPVVNNSRIIELDGDMSIQETEIESHKAEIEKIENIMASLTKDLASLELDVFYLKYVKSYSLRRISKKTHYSLSHIKRVSAKVKRKIGVNNSET